MDSIIAPTNAPIIGPWPGPPEINPFNNKKAKQGEQQQQQQQQQQRKKIMKKKCDETASWSTQNDGMVCVWKYWKIGHDVRGKKHNTKNPRKKHKVAKEHIWQLLCNPKCVLLSVRRNLHVEKKKN